MDDQEQPALFEGATSSKRRGRPPVGETPKRHRPGRVERALIIELRDTALSAAAQMHLRMAASLCDTAEAVDEDDTGVDVVAGTKAALAYLELRQAYGLAGAATSQLDPFAAFVAGMAQAGTADG